MPFQFLSSTKSLWIHLKSEKLFQFLKNFFLYAFNVPRPILENENLKSLSIEKLSGSFILKVSILALCEFHRTVNFLFAFRQYPFIFAVLFIGHERQFTRQI